jgi:hypothetical protein
MPGLWEAVAAGEEGFVLLQSFGLSFRKLTRKKAVVPERPPAAQELFKDFELIPPEDVELGEGSFGVV